MKSAPAVVAPSDVLGLVGPGRRAGALRVGGRVLSVRGRALTLCDALSALPVELTRASRIEAGDLIVVSGKLRRARLVGARIEARQRCPTPRGDGELARLLFDGVGRDLLFRARALAAIRSYFLSAGFVEVQTPQRVKTPGLDLHVDAIPAEGGYLVTSPEHHMKRLLVGGMPRIFQLCPASRVDELGPHHEPEFTILEWYRGFADQEAVMADTEAVVRAAACAISGRPEIVLPSGKRIELRRPFERITVREAFRRWANVRDATRLTEDRYFELLVGAIEPALAELTRPAFLCEYPIAQASYARKKPGDPRVAERFELYLGGLELCNGFGELTDPREQRARFVRARAQRKRLGRPVYALDDKLLDALTEGMPPSGGNALGVDRLIALCCGRAEISAVVAFPAARV